jgi:hypothetical protein
MIDGGIFRADKFLEVLCFDLGCRVCGGLTGDLARNGGEAFRIDFRLSIF